MSTGKMIHEGRDTRRIREMAGKKREALNTEQGDDWNQRKYHHWK